MINTPKQSVKVLRLKLRALTIGASTIFSGLIFCQTPGGTPGQLLARPSPLPSVASSTMPGGALAGASTVAIDSSRANIYNPAGKRDPFLPPAQQSFVRDLAAMDPTEKYPIDKFQLRAILKGMGKARAMFEDPEGRTFILVEGNTIGRERGTLSRVLNREVIVTEYTIDYLGRESLFERVIGISTDSEKDDGGLLYDTDTVAGHPAVQPDRTNLPPNTGDTVRPQIDAGVKREPVGINPPGQAREQNPPPRTQEIEPSVIKAPEAQSRGANINNNNIQ